MVLKLSTNASHIDFVFYSYIEGSVKDSEWTRRCTTPAIEISSLSEETLLPVDMASFWPSSANKVKLQPLLRMLLIENTPNEFENISDSEWNRHGNY